MVGPGDLDDALATARWDLVLVDWTHEGVDALAVCRAIRAHPRCLDLPVIVQASVEHGDRPAAALQAGADDYIVAPWEPVELLTRVRLALTARRASGAESRWQALVANLPGAVYRCELDADWTMHYISDQLLELTGYPPSDVIASARRTFASVIDPDDRARVEAEVAAAVDRAEPFVSYYRIVRADGEIRRVVDRGRLVDGQHGRRWLDGFIVDVTAQQEAEQRLRKTLAEQAATEERARIARDLHDSVSQSLFSMTLHARAAQLALERDAHGTGGPVHASVAELRELTQAALAEMRALIFELGHDALEDGLVAALARHASMLRTRHGLDADVQGPERLPLSARAQTQLFGIGREALANVVKHAGASKAWVHIEARSGRVLVEVRDDGSGFDSAARHPGHFGLESMHSRAAELGAVLTISSAPGAGTVVRVEAKSDTEGASDAV